MPIFRSLTAALFMMLSLATSALAQTRLPPSGAEERATSANRSIQRQGRIRGIEQQNQFEFNQLRQDRSRQELFLPPSGSGGVGRICAPGQLGC